ncbi:MAG TPA: NUDIX domain-containing protein [Candidatus Saccharimonadales bacterium]|nr:NUDIX domain-containing protein [Candidatus Saccharimonadales bacterium]
MSDNRLHKVQVSTLHTLRHRESARYSELMRPTGLDSDVFKFHIRNLVHQGLIQKREDGAYILTPNGKEFANNLDESARTTQKQPKLTLRICLSRINEKGELEYLFQERRRNPFWGYWDTIGGPILWGESIEDAASRELKKQTGLSASFTVKAFLRVRDFNEDTRELLEDKLFAVLGAREHTGELSNTWHGGHNRWMTAGDLLATGKYFQTIPKMLALLQSGLSYASEDVRYSSKQY